MFCCCSFLFTDIYIFFIIFFGGGVGRGHAVDCIILGIDQNGIHLTEVFFRLKSICILTFTVHFFAVWLFLLFYFLTLLAVPPNIYCFGYIMALLT